MVTPLTLQGQPGTGAENHPYLLLRPSPSKEHFKLLKSTSREEATSQASDLIVSCGCQGVEPAPAWRGNNLTIGSTAGDWTLVELEWFEP